MQQAFAAGKESGDTGLFDQWLKSRALDSRSSTLRSRLRREYERGFESKMGGQVEKPGKRVTSAGTVYKGWAINMTEGGAYVIPSIDRESEFDSIADAKRFIDSWKRNPVTDRAHRYRANQLIGVAGKHCLFCHSTQFLVPDHWDGHPDHTDPENLEVLCKSCNTAKGAAFKAAGRGRKTAQYNPSKVLAHSKTLSATRDLKGPWVRIGRDVPALVLERSGKGKRQRLLIEVKLSGKGYWGWVDADDLESQSAGNPTKRGGAANVGEWLQAVGAITPHVDRGDRGLSSEMSTRAAVDMIRATPQDKRRDFAARLIRRRNPANEVYKGTLYSTVKGKPFRIDGASFSTQEALDRWVKWSLGTKRAIAGKWYVETDTPEGSGRITHPNPRSRITVKGVRYDREQNRTYVDVETPEFRKEYYISGYVSKSKALGLVRHRVERELKEFSRPNPRSSAASLYESFHGVPSTHAIEVREEIHEHTNLALLGRLVEIFVETPTGYLAHIAFDEAEPVWLNSSEDGKQLYIEGGDQELDLAAFKMDGPEWVKDRMVIGQFAEPEPKEKGSKRRKWNIVYHTKKDFDHMVAIDYQHDLGEETGVRPYLEYEPANKRLFVSGGQYRIEQPMFETSPGIEN